MGFFVYCSMVSLFIVQWYAHHCRRTVVVQLNPWLWKSSSLSSSCRATSPCCIAMTNYTNTYADACRIITTKDERHSSLEKYTSPSPFTWKGCVWEGVGDRTELQHIDPHSFRSAGLLNQGPGGPASLGHVPQSSIFSSTGLIFNCMTSCLHPGYIIIWRPLFFLQASQIALIQPVHGQGYILIFLDRMHLLFTQVHFLFWQPGRVGGQYTTHGYPWSSFTTSPSGRSWGLHPVSSHRCFMYVRAGRPAFARPYAGVHRSTSLMSSSLLLQQCPACLVRLTWIVFVIGDRWPYSRCLVGCCRQDLFNIARNIFMLLPSSFFSSRLVSVQVVHPYSSIDICQKVNVIARLEFEIAYYGVVLQHVSRYTAGTSAQMLNFYYNKLNLS